MRTKAFKNQGLLKTQRTFGCEIECYNVDRNDLRQAMFTAGISTWDCWTFDDDCSIQDDNGSSYGINSLEVVSPILSGDEGLEAVYTVIQLIKKLGGKVNESCGLHVHWGINDLAYTQIQNLVKNYVKHEDVIDHWIETARREDSGYYCQSMIKDLGIHSKKVTAINETFKQIDEAKNLDELTDNVYNDRYQKVNLQSYYSYGTVEIRHHHATLDADQVINWIIFLGNFIEVSIAKKPRKLSQKQASMSLQKRFESLTKGLGLGSIKTRLRKQIEALSTKQAWSHVLA